MPSRPLLCIGCLMVLSAIPVFAETFQINVPSIAAAPEIDGVVDADGEWAGASSAPVMVPVAATEQGAGAGIDIWSRPSGTGRFWAAAHGGFLYLAFQTTNQSQMARAESGRDREVWREDSFEFLFSQGEQTLQIGVNASGGVYDSRDGRPEWNGPVEAAARVLGKDFAFETDTLRGFEGELRIPLSELWSPENPTRLQVILNGSGVTGQASWNPSQGKVAANPGLLVRGGGPNQLTGVEGEAETGAVKITGKFAEGAEVLLRPQGGKSKAENFPAETGALTVEPVAGLLSRLLIDAKDFRFGLFVKAPQPVPFACVPNPSRSAFYFTCHADRARKAAAGLYRFSLKAAGKTLWEKEVEAGPGTGAVRELIPYAGWPAGTVTFEAARLEPDGKADVLQTSELKVPGPLPDWAAFRLPEGLPRVPAPFTPVVAGDNQIAVWGRTFSLGRSLFLDQVQSQGLRLLARPVEVTGTVDGRPLAWTFGEWKPVMADEEQAVYEAVSVDGNLESRVRLTVYFDGVFRVDWTLGPKAGTVEVSDLRLVVPFQKDIATTFMHHKLDGGSFQQEEFLPDAGDIPADGMHRRFSHFFWVGNQKAGMQWFAEHRLNWSPRDEREVIEVRPGKDSTDLIFHLADAPRTLDRATDFSFGLMPSPIRPRPAGSELDGFPRIISLSSFGQILGERSRSPYLIIHGGEAAFGPQTSTEIDLRIDDPSVAATVPLFEARDDKGLNYSIGWRAKDGFLVASTSNGGAVSEMAAKPSPIRPGKWFRLQVNAGPGLEVAVDGRAVIQIPSLTLPTAAGSHNHARVIGGAGGISVGGWRISRERRPLASATPGTPFENDAIAEVVENLGYDPTALGTFQSAGNVLECPAYLAGSWTYDAAEDAIVAGKPRPPVNAAADYVESGHTAAVIMDYGREGLGHGGPDDPAVFKEALATANRHGLRLLPYTSWGINSGAEGFDDLIKEVSASPLDEPPMTIWRPEKGNTFFATVPVGAAANRRLAQIDEFMRAGAGGFYVDSMFVPQPTRNELVLGYDPVSPVTGKRMDVLPIYAQREFWHNAARLAKHHRPDAVIDAHLSRGFTLPTMAFVDRTTNGENVGAAKDWRPLVTPARVRGEYHGRQYGFLGDAIFYNNHPVPIEFGIALMGVHGQLPRTMWGMPRERAAALFRIFRAFDTSASRWDPYYFPLLAPFTSPDPDVLVSAFVHPDGRALVLATNWSDKENPLAIHCDWQAAGLVPRDSALFLNRNTRIPVKDGTVTITAPPRTLAILWIGDTKALEK